MEKWQEGQASAAEQEQLVRNDLAIAVHPKTPTGTSLALARPAAVLSFVLHLLMNTDLLFVSCNSVQLNYNTEQCKTTK